MEPEIPIHLASERDNIFADTSGYPKPFAFNEEVVRVFDDMVSRSVPLYREATRMAVTWAHRFYRENTAIYDIGCSTGTTMAALGAALKHAGRPASMIGIDNSAAMIDKAHEKLGPWRDFHHIDLRVEDVLDVKFENASVVIINYTLQFIPMAERKRLLAAIRNAMVPGGVLFLSDKVRGADPVMHEAMTHFYENFKRENGYSRTEIERKKEALDQVLVPLSFSEQLELIADAGFEQTEPVIKWNNFLS